MDSARLKLALLCCPRASSVIVRPHAMVFSVETMAVVVTAFWHLQTSLKVLVSQPRNAETVDVLNKAPAFPIAMGKCADQMDAVTKTVADCALLVNCACVTPESVVPLLRVTISSPSVLLARLDLIVPPIALVARLTIPSLIWLSMRNRLPQVFRWRGENFRPHHALLLKAVCKGLEFAPFCASPPMFPIREQVASSHLQLSQDPISLNGANVTVTIISLASPSLVFGMQRMSLD